MARTPKTALTDAQAGFGMTDDEVFGRDEPQPAPAATPTIHKVDMEGVIKAIGLLAKQMQASSATDRSDILARVRELQVQFKDSLKAVAEGARTVEMKMPAPPERKPMSWRVTIIRDENGDFEEFLMTPVDGTQPPKNSMEAALRAIK